MHAVEDAIKHAEQDSWQRSNPQTKVRAMSLVSLLESSIPTLEKDLEEAKAANNEAKGTKDPSRIRFKETGGWNKLSKTIEQ